MRTQFKADAFQRDARDVVQQVRHTFAAVIEAHCGGSPRAHEVADAFGVHRKLGWQIWNVAYADDPYRAIQLMPSARGVAVWCRAAETCGLAPELLARLTEASRLFEELVRRHARDRNMLEMMLDSCDPPADDQAALRWRKMSFTGESYTWGVHAKVLLATLILHPSARGGYFDMVRLHGLIGLVRTRPNVRWPIAQSVVYSGDEERQPGREPLVVSAATEASGVPLFEAFCSQPLAPVQRRISEMRLVEDELLPGPLGELGETTLFTAEIIREVAPVYAVQPGEDAMFGTGIRTPSAVFIYDLLVQRDLFPGVQRDLRVYSELVSSVSRDERDLLAVPERIQALGAGTGRLATAEVPRYLEMMQVVAERLSWKLADLTVYRVRMRYPPIPVSVMMHHDLPERPAGFQWA